MTKHINTDAKAREKLLTGINTVADIVKATLGPCGSNVILKKAYNVPMIVNDGVSIAKEVVLSDPTENAGAELLTAAASCTNSAVGDGTTTTCILTQGLIKEGFKEIEKGCNPILLREALKDTVEKDVYPLLEKQVELCDTLEKLQHVATISVGGKGDYGKDIGSILHKVGSEGIINIENNMYPETTWSMVEGYKIDKGYMTPYAINNTEKFMVDYPECLVLCCHHRIVEREDLEPLFQYAHQTNKYILLILDEMDESLFSALQVNLMRKVLNICPVRSPGFGFNVRDYMNDIAKLTGCVVYADDTRKMRTFNPDDFGFAKRVTANRECTCILRDEEESSEDLNLYVQSLRNQLKETENPHLIDSLKERISKLTVGVATISVGATSEAEQTELKLRIEDAINAARAALKSGIVTGGGRALAWIADSLQQIEGRTLEESAALRILEKALRLPEEQLLTNSGITVQPDSYVFKDYNYGFNARTKEYTDLKKEGIIDPAQVVRSALENSVSIASTVLTTQATIISEDKSES